MGEILRGLRKKRHLSQATAAKQVGKTQQAVNAWEHNLAKPTASTIEALAVLYQVTPNDIFGTEVTR
jgi:transcriptional regulator with XRE-family HTH domain